MGPETRDGSYKATGIQTLERQQEIVTAIEKLYAADPMTAELVLHGLKQEIDTNQFDKTMLTPLWVALTRLVEIYIKRRTPENPSFRHLVPYVERLAVAVSGINEIGYG